MLTRMETQRAKKFELLEMIPHQVDDFLRHSDATSQQTDEFGRSQQVDENEETKH